MIAITHRKLCRRPFLEQLGRVLEGDPEMVILREKDLSKDDLAHLAESCLELCSAHDVPLSINPASDVAFELGIDHVHLPLEVARREDLGRFRIVGVSVHGRDEALEAESLGADYLIAGHVFPTACKLGLEPRGTDFIGSGCGSVEIPVYAVGGITPDNVGKVFSAGAAGACAMSSMMTSEDPGSLVRALSACWEVTHPPSILR